MFSEAESSQHLPPSPSPRRVRRRRHRVCYERHKPAVGTSDRLARTLMGVLAAVVAMGTIKAGKIWLGDSQLGRAASVEVQAGPVRASEVVPTGFPARVADGPAVPAAPAGSVSGSRGNAAGQPLPANVSAPAVQAWQLAYVAAPAVAPASIFTAHVETGALVPAGAGTPPGFVAQAAMHLPAPIGMHATPGHAADGMLPGGTDAAGAPTLGSVATAGPPSSTEAGTGAAGAFPTVSAPGLTGIGSASHASAFHQPGAASAEIASRLSSVTIVAPPTLAHLSTASAPAHVPPAFSSSAASTAARPQPAAAFGAYTWSGGGATTGGDANWTTGANWINAAGGSGTAPDPAAYADIHYTTNPNPSTATTVNVNYAVNSLTFESAAGAGGSTTDTPSYNITANGDSTLTIGNSNAEPSSATTGIFNGSVNKQTVSAPVIVAADQTWNVSSAQGHLELSGTISGSSAVTKTGAGLLSVTSSAYSFYSGTITVSAGTLAANGTLLSANAIVARSGTLTGNGYLGGNALVQAGGTVAPGQNGTSALYIASGLTMEAGSIGSFTLGGTVPRDEYTQLQVGALIDLENPTLSLTLANGFVPKAGDKFFLIDSFSASEVGGIFKDLPEGTVFTIGGVTYKISYHDNDDSIMIGNAAGAGPQTAGFQNDVSLLVIAVPEPSAWVLLLLGGAGLWVVAHRCRSIRA